MKDFNSRLLTKLTWQFIIEIAGKLSDISWQLKQIIEI